MKTEVQTKEILTVQALEVTVVKLGENQHQGALASELDAKFLVELGLPGNLDTNPTTAAAPIGVAKEASPVEVLIFAQHVFVGDPEDAVAAKNVAELLLDLGSPLLGTV